MVSVITRRANYCLDCYPPRSASTAANCPRKGMRVARPACRDIVAVAHDKGRAVVVEGVARHAACFPAVVGSVGGHVEKVFRAGQCARDFLLHRHGADGLSGPVNIGAIIIRVPEADDPPDLPAGTLQRPGQRRGPSAEQDGAAAVGDAASSGEQHAMTDRRHRQPGGKKLGHELLQHVALEVLPHAARAMTAGKEESIEAGDTGLPPRQAGFVGRVLLHLRIGLPRICIGAHQSADGGETVQPGQEAPGVQALARDHHVVGLAGPAIGRGERDGMAEPFQHAPADSDLARIEIPARNRNEDVRHCNLRPCAEVFAAADSDSGLHLCPTYSQAASIRGGLARALVVRHMSGR